MDPDNAVLIVADSFAKLRRCDVFRLLEWNAEGREELAAHTVEQRPDLRAAVEQALAALKGGRS